MGEAKRRGSFEVRQKEAFERRAADTARRDREADLLDAERRRLKEERWASMSPEQRSRAMQIAQTRAMYMGALGSWLNGMGHV